jgi:hypothetical protein
MGLTGSWSSPQGIDHSLGLVSTDIDSIIPQLDIHRLASSDCNVCNPRVDVSRLAVSTDLDSHHPAVHRHRLVRYYYNAICSPRVDAIRLAGSMYVDLHCAAGRGPSTHGILLQRYL